jgi:AraC family ethanolamine operon transcriptional activator
VTRAREATDPPFRHSQRVLSDPYEFRDVVSGVSLDLDIMARNALPACVEQFQSASWALDLGKVHVKARVRGTIPQNWASLCFVRGGSSRWHGISGEAGSLLCVPPGEELDGNIVPGFEWTTVALPLELWRKCQAISGGEDAALKHFSGWQLSPATHSRITHGLARLQEALRTPTIESDRLAAGFVAELATTAWELSIAGRSSSKESVRNRARLARRADGWMRERLASPIQMPDVCLALRVSRRELEYAFRSTFNQSPRDHLLVLRLNALRRALQRGGDRGSVSRLALDCGLTHLGRLATQYRTLFGESPSATLRR